MNKLNHVAFIMDGNGRWGKRKKNNRNFGHVKGVDVVKKIVSSSLNLKIPILTFYVFSTENWKRPRKEINFLFKLIKNYFEKELHTIINQGIRIKVIGEINSMSPDLKLILKKAMNYTKHNKKIIVNLAINYGSKIEIINAFKKIKKKSTEKSLNDNLYTSGMSDPDILIRTGGHRRLSNFMLWQLAYTELFFVKKLWPDFKSKDLEKIIHSYKKSKRNFGAI